MTHPVFEPVAARDPMGDFYCSISGISNSVSGGSSAAWKFDAAGRSDVGRIREGNEDCHSARSDLGLFIVADGMGGHNGGEVASRMAVDGVEEFTQITPAMTPAERLDALRGAFNLCSSQVYHRGSSDRQLVGMGATLAVLHLDEVGGRYYVAYAGDSRVYRIRGGKMERLTEDHSLQNEWKKMGSPADRWSLLPRSIITRAVGVGETVEADVATGELQAGDLFLLCTDGLTEVLYDSAILKIILDHEDLGKACGELIARANEGGGPDNITAVLVRAVRAG